MGNAYWAGSLPGLILATIASVGLARQLDRPGLRNIVWLAPALHFAGGFIVGPALSLLFAYFTRWLPGGVGTWTWPVGFLLAGGLVGGASSRAASDRRSWRFAILMAEFTTAGVLIPAFYYLIAA